MLVCEKTCLDTNFLALACTALCADEVHSDNGDETLGATKQVGKLYSYVCWVDCTLIIIAI